MPSPTYSPVEGSAGGQRNFIPSALLAILLLASCSHSRSTAPARRLFLISDQGAAVSCAESFPDKGTVSAFYTVTRVGKDGGKTSKIVIPPKRPTLEERYKGTWATRELPRAPRLNARQVIDAPPAGYPAPHRMRGQDTGREPMNILPAVVLASPVLVAGSVAGMAVEPFIERDPIGSLESQGVGLGVSKADTLRILGRKATVAGDGIRVGPGWSLRDRSAWLEFQNERLIGIYSGDFYPLGR